MSSSWSTILVIFSFFSFSFDLFVCFFFPLKIFVHSPLLSLCLLFWILCANVGSDWDERYCYIWNREYVRFVWMKISGDCLCEFNRVKIWEIVRCPFWGSIMLGNFALDPWNWGVHEFVVTLMYWYDYGPQAWCMYVDWWW